MGRRTFAAVIREARVRGILTSAVDGLAKAGGMSGIPKCRYRASANRSVRRGWRFGAAGKPLAGRCGVKRTDVIGVVPTDDAILPVVGASLPGQNDEGAFQASAARRLHGGSLVTSARRGAPISR
jgi:hypothetical protein